MVECLFSGNIDVDTICEQETIISGLAGQSDTGKDSLLNYYIHDCRVRGNITFKGGSNETRPTVTGVLGQSKNYSQGMYITNSFFEGGNITVNGTTLKVEAGGFCGGLQGPHTVNNCGTLDGTITVNVGGSFNNFNIGGFSTNLAGFYSNCFSRIDIVVERGVTAVCNVGGFTGTLSGNSTISECYATGNVSVAIESTTAAGDHGDNMFPIVGGLVGYCQGAIENSYALGNVLVSDSGNNTSCYAGGLVGVLAGGDSNDGSIINCFSAGRVSAQCTPTKAAYSGGIAGYYNVGTISNTAALGASVTALGGTTASGRITANAFTGDNNYALKTMSIETGASDVIDITFTSRPAVSSATGRDGQDAISSAFLTQAFWKTTLKFDQGVGPYHWNFSRVARDGYPRLKWEQ